MENVSTYLAAGGLAALLAFAFPHATFATGTVSPDLLISEKAGGPFRGDDIKNGTGAGQSLNRRTRGKAVTSFIKAQPEGARGTVTIDFRGKKGNRNFTTRYFFGPANVTAALVKGTLSVDIDAGAEIVIRQKVRPTRRLKGKNGNRRYPVTATHAGNVDAVRINVRKRR